MSASLKIPESHSFAIGCTATVYVSLALFFILGTLIRWDGQGAILLLPFMLMIYLALPAAIVASLVALRKNAILSLALIALNAVIPIVIYG